MAEKICSLRKSGSSGQTAEFITLFNGNRINGLTIGKKYLLTGTVVSISSGGTVIESHANANTSMSIYFLGYTLFKATSTSLVLVENGCGAICLID